MRINLHIKANSFLKTAEKAAQAIVDYIKNVPFDNLAIMYSVVH